MDIRFVLVSPGTSGLTIREAAWDRLWQAADPYGGVTSEFVIHRVSRAGLGMQGLVADAAWLAKDRYPPNHLAGQLVGALGGPDRYWFGDVVICGLRLGDTGEPVLCGLDDNQCRLVRQAYSAVHEEA